jgi:hypothetical protein
MLRLEDRVFASLHPSLKSAIVQAVQEGSIGNRGTNSSRRRSRRRGNAEEVGVKGLAYTPASSGNSDHGQVI